MRGIIAAIIVLALAGCERSSALDADSLKADSRAERVTPEIHCAPEAPVAATASAPESVMLAACTPADDAGRRS